MSEAQVAKSKPTPKASTAVKLWSPHGNMEDGSTHIGLTSGHTFIVPSTKEGVEVPKRFRREAIARGCLPVGMEDEPDEAPSFDRELRIVGKIREMFDGDDPTHFGTDGKPKLDALSKLVGFTVDRSERDRLWSAFEREQLGDGSE